MNSVLTTVGGIGVPGGLGENVGLLWLNSLRHHLPPSEELARQRLEKAFGQTTFDSLGRSSTSGVWVGPTGPLDDATIARMDVDSLLGLMRNPVRSGPNEAFGPSPDGLARQVHAEIVRRRSKSLVRPRSNRITHKTQAEWTVIAAMRSSSGPGPDQTPLVLERPKRVKCGLPKGSFPVAVVPVQRWGCLSEFSHSNPTYLPHPPGTRFADRCKNGTQLLRSGMAT